MRKVILVFTLILLPMLANAKPILLKVKGMVCAFCAQGIEKKLKALPEVAKVKVSLESKLVELETKEGKDIPDESLTKLINESGYDVEKIERAK